MNRKYTKSEFQALDADTKELIIEELLGDDFYEGQTEIGYYVPEGFKGEIGEPLPPTPPEIEKIEDEKYELLINKLTDKLFEENSEIEFDLEKTEEEIEKYAKKLRS